MYAVAAGDWTHRSCGGIKAGSALSCPEISTRRDSGGGNAAICDLGVIIQHQVNIGGDGVPGHNVNIHGSAVNNALRQLNFCWAMCPKEKNIWGVRLWNEKFEVRDV